MTFRSCLSKFGSPGVREPSGIFRILSQNALRLRQMSQAARPNPALRMHVLLFACSALLCAQTTLALDPSLDIGQYAHTAWTVRDGFSLGNVYAMAQTPDGYLWLGSEFGLFRFDGVRRISWQPPAGPQLPDRILTLYSLRATALFGLPRLVGL